MNNWLKEDVAGFTVRGMCALHQVVQWSCESWLTCDAELAVNGAGECYVGPVYAPNGVTAAVFDEQGTVALDMSTTSPWTV